MAVKTKTKKSSQGKPERKKFITPVFRASFVQNLFRPRRSEDDDNATPKFGLTAIWTPKEFSERDRELWKAIKAELNRVSLKTFGKEWAKLPANVKRGIRDGAEKDGLDGYGEGTKFASLTSKNRPGVIFAKTKEEISPEEGNADEIYPGCYCQATVTVYSYDNKGKGVALGLRNLRKIKDGPRLDNRVAAEDDFDEEVDSAWLDEDDEDISGVTDDEDFDEDEDDD